MEFRQLKYFVTIASELHFGRAAEKLYISQPALSQQIKQLEEEIGVELFTKKSRVGSRTIELTEAGTVFLVEARRLLQLADKAIETARRIGRHQNIIRLGIYKMLFRDRIVELLKLFSEKMPDLEVKIIELPTFLSVQEALEDEAIDLGVTLSPLKFSGLDFKDFKKGYLSVLMPQNHPLAERESVTLADLHREKWIEIDKTTHPIFNDIEKMCQDAGFTRTIVQEVSSLDLLGSLVSLGLGIAFVPTFFDADRVGGVVLKKITNLDGAPLQTVALNQVLAFKKEKLDNAILALI